METIQIEISSELARRLRPYQSELPRILEWGLRRAEGKTEAESNTEARSLQERIVAALRQAGAVGTDPEKVAQYLSERSWTPVEVGGKPLSEMIVEERNSRPWARW